MMTKELERRLSQAIEFAKLQRQEFVTLEHVLLALLESPEAAHIITAVGGDVPTIKNKLRENIKKNSTTLTADQIHEFGGDQWQPEFTIACHRLFQRAALQVRNAGRTQITEGHILIALYYESDSYAVYVMSEQGISQFDLIQFVSHGYDNESTAGSLPPPPYTGAPGLYPPGIPAPGSMNSDSDFSRSGDFDVDGFPKDKSNASTDKFANPQTPPTSPTALDQFCVNLNEKAKNKTMDPLIGRMDVLERTMQVLARRQKNNPLLIGEPGVGKTAIAEGLAQKIVEGQVPEALKDKVIYALDMGGLLAGTKFRGDFESRLKAIIREIKKKQTAVLFIDEIHTLVGAGATSGGSLDASNLLKPALANGEISCIGSTTHQEYRQHFEKDRALNRRFQKIDVKEPSEAECFEILKGLRSRFEEFHQVKYSDDVLQSSIALSQKYIHSKLLPDKAIDVIDEVGSQIRLQGKKDYLVLESDVEGVVARMAQVPVQSVTAQDRKALKDLDKKLKALIFGQDEAIDRLVNAIKLNRTGLGRDNKPIGSFLFAGPTGVGKTEVCKQLASILGVPFLRFDMSEYMEKHTVARLVGAPPGYVGFEEGGQLTESITKSPYSVLLLDEIEKAHTDIYNILLQVMDAGRLTDANGRTADFRNVILVMTSNAGAADLAKGTIGFASADQNYGAMDAIKKIFSPEFINRLDAIVSFKHLDQNILLDIAKKFVHELQMQLQKQKVDLHVDEAAMKWLAQKGYDKVYGARPMSRTIEEYIKKTLVDELLFGKLVHGGRILMQLNSSETGLTMEIEELSPVTV